VAIILLSPELTVSKVFRTIAIDYEAGLIVVDEDHLAKWGKGFRTDYTRLHQLRGIFGKKVL
jgi:superfamily II DNA helicase RecQ